MAAALGLITDNVFIGAMHWPKGPVPDRRQKDKPAQREHRKSGVTKQHVYRRAEPISPAGNLVDAPKGNAVTLRRTLEPLISLQGSGAQSAYLFGAFSPPSPRTFSGRFCAKPRPHFQKTPRR